MVVKSAIIIMVTHEGARFSSWARQWSDLVWKLRVFQYGQFVDDLFLKCTLEGLGYWYRPS